MNLVYIVRLSATPVFWVLALYTVLLPRDTVLMCGQNLTPTSAVLSSMWLMYALMGLFHSSPWLSLLQQQNLGSVQCCDNEGGSP